MAMAVSSQQSRDAALLRATTELFVLDKTHDQAGIRRFEELATHFLTKVSAADRAFVAERLARHPDTPGSILRMLGKDLPEIASPILRHAPGLNSFDVLAIMAATGPAHFRILATRADLAPDVVAALRLTGDAETIALLPAVPDEDAPAPSRPAPTEPLHAAMMNNPVAEPAKQSPFPSLEAPLTALTQARALAASLSAEMSALASQVPAEADSRALPVEPVASEPQVSAEIAPDAPLPLVEPMAVEPQAPATAEVPLNPTEAFLRLEPAERLALLKALSPAPVSTPRLSSIQIDHAFRAALSRARLPMLARQRQRDALIAALSDGLRLDLGQITALLEDRSGEALVVLLKAIGLSDSEAQQVLLFANPVMREAVETFFRLTELLQGLQQPAANRLVAQWRGESEGEAAHQPHYADAPRKDAHTPRKQDRPAALDNHVLAGKIA